MRIPKPWDHAGGGRGRKGGRIFLLLFLFGRAKRRPGKKKTDGVIGRWITKTLRRPRSSRGKRLRRGLLIPLFTVFLGVFCLFALLSLTLRKSLSARKTHDAAAFLQAKKRGE